MKSSEKMSGNDDKSGDMMIINDTIEAMDNRTLENNEDSMKIEIRDRRKYRI